MIKIKKIKIENNPILWNLDLDFTKDDGSIYDTILFVGENGSGKSTLMDILYQFTRFEEQKLAENERRELVIDLSESNDRNIQNGIYKISFDLRDQNNVWGWDYYMRHYVIRYQENDYSRHVLSNYSDQYKNFIKSIFSVVSINFNAKIETSTNKELDKHISESLKSGEDIAKDITQTLVDIGIADDGDFATWWRTHPEEVIDVNQLDIRSRRFKTAFNEMFSDTWLTYKWVYSLNPIFEKNNQEIEINRLSSGEKQIVFRWGFLLKDKQSISWALVLVDEPEISMHPRWQKKALDFYKNLFRDWAWNQTSQLIITTHSPYVLHSYNSNIDCVVVFSSEWIKKIDSMRAYIWTTPSLWVINWYAFNLPTIEFHDELYWYIQDKTQNYTIPKFENYVTNLLRDRFDKTYNRIEEVNGTPQSSKPCTLQTFIRNKIHHPENISMQHVDYTEWELKQSIEDMIKCINNNSL